MTVDQELNYIDHHGFVRSKPTGVNETALENMPRKDYYVNEKWEVCYNGSVLARCDNANCAWMILRAIVCLREKEGSFKKGNELTTWRKQLWERIVERKDV